MMYGKKELVGAIGLVHVSLSHLCNMRRKPKKGKERIKKKHARKREKASVIYVVVLLYSSTERKSNTLKDNHTCFFFLAQYALNCSF